MNGIIFDLDGVLVNSMPIHYKGWKTAFEEITSLKVDERSVYVLEGMRGIDLVKEIFIKYRIDRMKLDPSNVLVVENAPLGVEAAKRAGIEPLVVLNNSPLKEADFIKLISREKIFPETKSIENKLVEWCNNEK